MGIRKRTMAFVLGALMMASVTLTGCSGQATQFPNRSVEMVIPFGAGGASDIFARQYADIAKDYLGTTITAVNKSGSGTVEGMAYVANSPTDGYTILEITPSVLIKDITGEFPFSEEFEPLIKVQNDLMVFGVAADSEFETMEQLMAYALENPGDLKIGGLSPGGLDDYTANGFSLLAGFDWTYVPYTSGSEVKSAVLGGELDVYQDKLSSFLPLVESGDIRPLVVLSDTRVDDPLLEDVPCSVELGVDFTQGSWRGFVIAKGTPEEEKQIIIDALIEAYQDPRYAELEESSYTNFSVGFETPEEFAASMEEEMEGLRSAFTQMGLIDEDGNLTDTEVAGDLLGAMGFPSFVACLAGVLALYIFLRGWKRAGSLSKIIVVTKPASGLVTTVCCLGGYIALMNYLGFALSTLLFTFLNTRLMGYKNYKVLIVFSLLLTGLIVAAFGNLFLVPLPRGLGILRDISYYLY